jgi:phosphatidylserine/phosphatidylglycerophosphate/cardiolipin synthase-like enzyme
LLLQPGSTCWRVERAPRFSLLVDNAAYFQALHEALVQARESILLLGWTLDPRTNLGEDLRDHSMEVGHLLRRLVRERPELDVRLLIWRSPLPIAWSQEFFPWKAGAWFEKSPIKFVMDRARPLGACHHQKVVVIDNQVAFCGGGDVSVDRWDTPDHWDNDERRRRPSGIPVPPRHEVMTVMDGAAAQALGDLARQRWLDATGEVLEPCKIAHDPWPKAVRPDMTDVTVGIARTEPAWRDAPAIRENETLHLEAIARAKSLIYLENQYVTSPLFASALADRLQEPDGPEVVIVSTGQAPSWFDRATMDQARRALIERLEAADCYGRLSTWAPRTGRGGNIIVHSKVTIIDDCMLRVGSTNLNNRSGGFDTECDVAVEAAEGDAGEATRAFIRRFRSHLIAHYYGRPGADLDEAQAQLGKLGYAIAALEPAPGRGGLRPLIGKLSLKSKTIANWQIGDPLSPADAWRPWKRRKLTQALIRAVATPEPGDGVDQAAAAAAAISKSTISGR